MFLYSSLFLCNFLNYAVSKIYACLTQLITESLMLRSCDWQDSFNTRYGFNFPQRRVQTCPSFRVNTQCCFFFFFFCVLARSDPLHQWDEREHSPAGGHAVWAHSQLQLGGGLQSSYHHPPPHDVRQRGRRHHTHTHTDTNKSPPGQSEQATSISDIITQPCLNPHTHKSEHTQILKSLLFMSVHCDQHQRSGRVADPYGT